jgi:hypothetical protein
MGLILRDLWCDTILDAHVPAEDKSETCDRWDM